MVLRLIDWTIQTDVPVALRVIEKFVSRGEGWIVSIPPSGKYRSKLISQGEDYSKVRTRFFFLSVNAEGQRKTVLSKICLFSDISFLQSLNHPPHKQHLLLWFPETTSHRESWRTNHELISIVVSVTQSTIPIECVCPNGRRRRCGFMWSYKPSGWAELC